MSFQRALLILVVAVLAHTSSGSAQAPAFGDPALDFCPEARRMVWNAQMSELVDYHVVD